MRQVRRNARHVFSGVEGLENRVFLAGGAPQPQLLEPAASGYGVTSASLTVQTPGLIGASKVVPSNTVALQVDISGWGDGMVNYSGFASGSVQLLSGWTLLNAEVGVPQSLGPVNVQLVVGGIATNQVEIDVCGITSANMKVNGGTAAVSVEPGGTIALAANLVGWGGSAAVGGTSISYNWEYAPVGSDSWTILPDESVMLNGASASITESLAVPGPGAWNYRLETLRNGWMDWGVFHVTSNPVEVNVGSRDLTGQFTGTLPSAAALGATISPRLSITSDGGAVTGTELTNYYLSADPNPSLDSLDNYLGNSTEDLDLVEGASYTEQPDLVIPAGTAPGTYYLVAVINVSHGIPETDYSNDVVVRGPISITPATETAVASGHTPSVFGEAVTFAATVIAKAPGAGTPTGTVDFYAGDTWLDRDSLDSAGHATCTTGSGDYGLPAGTCTIRAVYNGDADHPGATSGQTSQVVQRDGTVTTVVSSLNPSLSGQAVIFTATVTANAPGGGTRTGMVSFYDGAALLGSGPLDGTGHATLITGGGNPGLAIGVHAITAVYAGDADFTGSNSRPLSQTVKIIEHLAFAQQPTDAVVARKIMPAVVVTLRDQSGNLVTADHSTVRVSIATGPAGGTLIGTTRVTAGGGLATFRNLALSQPGNYTLQLSDGALTPIVSNPFNVYFVPTHLVFAQQPAGTVAGHTLAPLVVDIRDARNRIDTTNNSSITVAIATGPAAGALAGTLTVQAINGVATFSALSLAKAGRYTLKVTDGALVAATSKRFKITPDTQSSRLVLAQRPASTLVGKSLSPALVVNVQDQFGNLVTTGRSRVTLGILGGPAGAAFIGTYAVNAVRGVATFRSVALSIAGTYSLQASDSTLAIATPVSFAQTVTQGTTTIRTPNVAMAYTFGQTNTLSSQLKSDAPAATDFTGTVTITDEAGNIMGTAIVSPTGKVKLVFASPSAGIRTCTINYPGDANHTAATSAPFALNVNPAPT